jgi:uncharacterized damage-inducible protein DinB
MQFSLDDAIQVLQTTPHVLRAMLSDLSARWTHSNYGEATFSPIDVIGHLISGEKTDWMPRVRIILEHGSARAFDPYDRYAQFEESRGRTLKQLLDEFEQLRSANITTLRNMRLSDQQLALYGQHPVLGKVMLSQVLATWVAHDLNHIGQIAKCIATQYAEAIGPWKEYLTILKSNPLKMDAEGTRRRRNAEPA